MHINIKQMASSLTLILGLALSVSVAQAGEGESFPQANVDPRNLISLQHGARNFMNYCSGCHSAKFVRYNRIAADLGIPEAELKKNLMFTTDKVADTIQSAMPEEEALHWFGVKPPDLSLIARSRGTDHVYAYLRSFYTDPSRPRGVYNTVLPGTAMPNVLGDLQGEQIAVFKTGENGAPEFEKFESVSKGSMTPEEYDLFVRDTVNFLQYMAEPVQNTRKDIGIWVMLFLAVFTSFAYLLYKEVWRDVH